MSTMRSNREVARIAVRLERRTQHQPFTSYLQTRAGSNASGRFWARFHCFEGRLIDIDAPSSRDGWEVRYVDM